MQGIVKGDGTVETYEMLKDSKEDMCLVRAICHLDSNSHI